MAVELRSVYFTGDGTWFTDRKSAELYEKRCEAIEYLTANGIGSSACLIGEVVDALVDRYELNQRWDWKEPDTAVPATDEIEP